MLQKKKKGFLGRIIEKATKEQLILLEKRAKKYPCSIQDREIKIAKENVEEAFGNKSKEMERLKKIIIKKNKCSQ